MFQSGSNRSGGNGSDGKRDEGNGSGGNGSEGHRIGVIVCDGPRRSGSTGTAQNTTLPSVVRGGSNANPRLRPIEARTNMIHIAFTILLPLSIGYAYLDCSLSLPESLLGANLRGRYVATFCKGGNGSYACCMAILHRKQRHSRLFALAGDSLEENR